MHRLTLILILLFAYLSLASQGVELRLSDCLQMAEANSPILASKPLQAEQLVAKTKRLNRSLWPQMNLNGKATWQSDVLSIPLNFPGVEIPTPPTEQYGLSLDIQQILWDGGVSKAKKQVAEAMTLADYAQLDVNFHQVKGQVLQLFFGAMLADKQYDYLELLSLEVQRQLDRLTHAVDNGIAIVSDQNQLLAKKLELDMEMQSADHRKAAALAALGQWTGKSIAFDTKLVVPEESLTNQVIQRPELFALDAAANNLVANEQLLRASNLPKLGAFAQLGYGQPGLNLFLDGWDSYAVVGAKLSIPLSWMYSGSQRLDVQQLELKKMQIGLQKKQIVLQTETARITQEQEVQRLITLANTDDQLVKLREEITVTVAVQLKEGIITPTEYLTAVNNEELARQNQLLHQVQKMQAIATYNWLSGY